MAHILTPPASRHVSAQPEPSDSSADLSQSLDDLLERYLLLLDKHQKLQADLASRLSSGFFSLAQANYTCPPGRRYGADYYDERMKATKRIAFKPHPNESNHDEKEKPVEDDECDSKPTFTVETVAVNEEEVNTGSNEETEPSQSSDDHATKQRNTPGSDSTEHPTGLTTPDESSENDEPTANSMSQSSQKKKKKSRSTDPIRWYGILVPPFLRSSQRSFTEAICNPIPELASVTVEMQALKKEITRLRGKLGQV